MLVFPHAKINLGLHVLRERADGYRDIETILMPIPLSDVLEVVISTGVPKGRLEFTRSGLEVPGDPSQDLCVRAHGLLKAGSPLPGLRMHLHKAIPIGAGLGGGSSDGAHALMLINTLLGLRISSEELQGMAAQLGSDCPFFLQPGPQLAQGRGDVLVPATTVLSGWWLMLVNPGIHVGTAEVYANTPCAPGREDLSQLVGRTPPGSWRGRLMNVMENHVSTAFPSVAAAKQLIEGSGAVYAAMSGSGSSVFGLFPDRPVLPALPSGYRGWILRL